MYLITCLVSHPAFSIVHVSYELVSILMHSLLRDAPFLGHHMAVCWNTVQTFAFYFIHTVKPLAGTSQRTSCSAVRYCSRFAVTEQSPCWKVAHQRTYAVVLNDAPLGAYAQQALAMLSAAAVPLVTSSRTAPGPLSIFNPAHLVLSDHGVQLTEDPLCGTAVRVAVRLRGSGPSGS